MITRQFALSKVEKNVLFRKYMNLGLTAEQSKDRIDERVQQLRDLVKKLRKKKLSDKEINIKFKGEFEKMCMRAEV